MRPSTWAGTPESICVGAVPRRAGQLARTSSWLPPIPPELTITAPAVSSNSPTTSRELDRPRPQSSGARTAPADAVDGAVGDRQGVDAMSEAQLDEPVALSLADRGDERLDQAWPGSPRDVEAGDGVALSICEPAAALGPADVGKEANPLLVQPRPLLARGPIDVRLCPAARPLVLGPVESGRAEPVLPGELARVLDPQAALLGAVDEEEPAERPERLPAEGLLRLLLDEDHALPGGGQLGGRDEPGKARADDDGVGLSFSSGASGSRHAHILPRVATSLPGYLPR